VQPTLAIAESVELGPGDDDDERSLQVIACPCGFEGAGFYRESRRGSGESVHHTGYRTTPEQLAEVRAAMARKQEPPELWRIDSFPIRWVG
jgi:hypothetical protein